MSRWARRLAVVLALLALVGLGARLAVGWWTRSRLETARDAFETAYGTRVPADLAPPPVPAEENMAPALLALIEELGTDDLRWRDLMSRVNEFHGQPLEVWSEEDMRTAEEFALACGPIERYEDLASRQRSDFEIDYSQGWSTPLPPFIEILGVARCALVHGRLGLSRGAPAEFLAAYRALDNVARGLANEPMLISQLLGIAVARHSHYLLAPALERGALDAATLEALLDGEEGPPLRERLVAALETEALMVAATPSRVLLTGVMDDGALYLPRLERALTYLKEPSGDLIRLATLENRSREIDSLDGDAVELLRALDDGTFYDAEHRLRDQLAPNIEDILLKVYAADTVDLLERSALEVARDVAMGQSELMAAGRAEPMSGEPLLWRATDTHLIASAPGAARIWADRSSESGSLPPIFEWRVALESPSVPD